MREIKFRAWDKQSKEMFVPNELVFSKNGIDINKPNPIGISDWRNAILMQLTGLKDKNGKEIFEGDIVRTEFGAIQEIKMEPFSGGGYENSVKGFGVAFYDDEPSEVIGNIYSNPELLK